MTEPIWEDPPEHFYRSGRPSPMSALERPMRDHEGSWLIFNDNVSKGYAASCRKLYGARGFEFTTRHMDKTDPHAYRVWARYVGIPTEEEE